MAVRIATLLIGAVLLLLGPIGCPGTGPPPPNFGIVVFAEPRDPIGFLFVLTVNGTSFTPGGSTTVSYASIPNRSGVTPGRGPFPAVGPNGDVSYKEAVLCTSNDPSDAAGTVLVTMQDVASGHVALSNISACYWVCGGVPGCG
jgi:hypothetical protein